MMTAASFLYVMMLFVEKVIVLNLPNYARILRYLARSVFASLLVILALSRMYFATHFLHQCILGATMGICVAETVTFMKFINKFEAMNRRQWFKVGGTMSAIVAAIFWMHKLITGNPMASVQLVS